jgi:polyisoprenoid-binding protein YceI
MNLKIFSGCLFILTVLVSRSTAQTLIPSAQESSASFTIRNFGLNVDGVVSGFTGVIIFDTAHLQESIFDVMLESKSIDTGIALRDTHLKKKEFLDADHYPYIHFISKKITNTDQRNRYYLMGNLTLKGTTKEVGFFFTAVASANGVTVFEGDWEINRRDYNVGKSNLGMSDIVRIKLHVVARNSSRQVNSLQSKNLR